METYENLGVIKNEAIFEEQQLNNFENRVNGFKEKKQWSKAEIVKLFFEMIPDFNHMEKGKYLDGKM